MFFLYIGFILVGTIRTKDATEKLQNKDAGTRTGEEKFGRLSIKITSVGTGRFN